MNLAALKEGLNEFDFRTDGSLFADADNTGILGADVAVHLDVTKRHEAYDCLFGFAGELQVACDRCLEAVPVVIDTDYHVTVRHGEEYDDSNDDVLVIPESWTHLDMEPLMRDTLMLEIPLRCVHPDGGCDEEMASRLREHGSAGSEGEEEE